MAHAPNAVDRGADADDGNLYATLRAGFPADLDALAIQPCDGPCAQRMPDAHYTWRDLERGSARLANLLASLSLPPASRIAVQVDKSVEALMLYLAVLRAGHVMLPLNAAYQAGEVEYFVGNASPAVFVCTPQAFVWASRLAFAQGVGHVFTLGDDRTGTLLERAALHADTQAVVPRGRDDLAAILYTSGTTGRSKGAMLTHGNLRSNSRVLDAHWGFAEARANGTPDVLVHVLPIFHVHGLFVAVHAALLAGASMRWFDRFDAPAAVAALRGATVFMGVPTLYTRMLAQPGLDRAACATMRLFVSGSAPLQIETFDAWRERTGHVILERYGMSETVMLTSNPWRGEGGAAPDRRRGTVGPALPGVGLRIVDDAGRRLADGEVGQVQVTGPNVFAGYWRMPEKNAEEFVVEPDGTRWFRTGDVGSVGDGGWLTLVGRSKDLIISGGYNVYPAEVEMLLNEQPGVAESAVVGVPHPDFGEAVIAIVTPRPGATVDAQALQQACKARIAGFKVPKRVFVVDELPRNAMGKVQKNLLRDAHRTLFTPPA